MLAAAMLALLVAMVLALVRALSGPTVYDRILAVNTFGTKTRVNGIGFDALYENYYETQAIMLSLELKI